MKFKTMIFKSMSRNFFLLGKPYDLGSSNWDSLRAASELTDFANLSIDYNQKEIFFEQIV